MLTALDLFGFKSFADKTRFDFSKGVTAVVGPNGSGKSNVVDALKWIFGDQSAKSLRGKEMTDVIFNGAANRKASSYAEAVLTFDNQSGFLPVESTEVQIGRRLWRNGDSEYLINQQVARLKDVRNLLMGTGVGAAAYCIIEQGRVDQILQANASTRRVVFEEAAGISRYKSRRTEALRKLERVEQNLLRLTDIVDEVESQLSALRSQAAKATRHRELSQRLKATWIGLAADDFRLLSQERAQIETDRLQLLEASEECEQQQQQLADEVESTDSSLSELDDRLRALEQDQTQRRERIAATEATARHQRAQLHELSGEVVRLRRQLRTMRGRSNETLSERRHLQSVLARQQQDLDELTEEATSRQDAVDSLSENIEETRKQLESLRTNLLAQLKERSTLSGMIENLKSRRSELETRVADGSQQLQASQEQLDQRKADLQRAEEASRQAAERLAAAEAELSEMQASRNALLGEQGQYQRSLADLRETRSGWEARRSVLEDLESRQEGLGIGVREILNRAQSSPYAPWTEVLGSVADLLEVDLEHAAIVEVALGRRAQLIVVRRLAPLVDYLKMESTRISGRVAFLGLDTTAVFGVETSANRQQQASAQPDFSGRAGVVCRADSLVQAVINEESLPSRLLGDTWVVERLEDAIRLYRDCGGVCRFVTLQGELVDQDGALRVGSLHSEPTLMSRKSELRRLRHDLSRLDARIEEEEFRLTKLAETVTSTDSQIEEVEAAVGRAVSEHHAADAQLDSRRQALARQEHDHLKLSELCAADARRLTELDREQASSVLRLEQLESGMAAGEVRQRELDQQLAAAELNFSRGRDELTRIEVAVEQQRERIASTQESFRRLERDCERRRQEDQEAHQRLQAVQVRLGQTALQILNHQAVLAEEMIELDHLSASAASVIRQRTELKASRSELLSCDVELRTRHREIEDRMHELEIRERDCRHRLATLESRIAEEYSVSVAESAESGISAFRDYLESQGPTEETGEPATELDQGGPADGSGAVDPPARPDNPLSEADSDVFDVAAFAEVRPRIEEEVESLRRKLKHLGSVSTESLDSLEELESRFEVLSTQLSDLQEARNALDEIIRRINAESRRMFLERFESIREHFQELYRKLFGGGEGDILLEDMDDVLECGIEIVARPPGKELRSLSLLSGGEKTMTAVALLLAIFRSRPSPFCVLDEVDAALDEANVGRFVGVLKEFQDSTQFIMITHRKPSMASADVLYGVTMEESGVSKRMSVRFDDIGEDGEFRPHGGSEDQSVAA